MKPQILSEPAEKGYSVASAWESSAVLGEPQLRAIDLVAQQFGKKQLGQSLEDENNNQKNQSIQNRSQPPIDEQLEETQQGVAWSSALEDAVLRSAHDFYKWHSQLEAARTRETDEKYRQYADVLHDRLRTCQDLLSKVEDTLEILGMLQGSYKDVAGKTKTLHDSCQQLVQEKEQLLEFSKQLNDKLRYFDELEQVSGQFHSNSVSVESETFLPLLQKLDECLTFVASNPQYAESALYAGRFRQLQARALAQVRSKVAQVFKNAAQQIQSAIKNNQTQGNSNVNGSSQSSSKEDQSLVQQGAEMALLYVRFRALSEPRLKSVLASVEQRNQRSEYSELVQDCQKSYCEVRLQLMTPPVQTHIRNMQQQSLADLTRQGCTYLVEVCRQEVSLFKNFFPASGVENSELGILMDPLCMLLYDLVRPAIIQLVDLEDLIQLLEILRFEVIEEQLATNVGQEDIATRPLRPMLQRIVADVQERLIYRIQACIREEIAGYQPVFEDLDFPHKLEQLNEGKNGNDSSPPQSEIEIAKDEGGNLANGNQSKEYETWYPPVRHGLWLLSRLYRCMDKRIFGGLAQETVSACTVSIQHSSRMVARQQGTLDGQLYLVRHLLILREQIAPFKTEFSFTEIDLDFSHMRDYLRRIVLGETSLFSLSQNNALIQLVGKGGPRVLENQVDSKKELDRVLKSSCEALIMTLTKLTVDPMLSFITKKTAVAALAGSTTQRPSLKQHAFADPERVKEMVDNVNEALQNKLPLALSKMKLYITSSSAINVLMKPIKSNIAEAHGQIAQLLQSEYTTEEVAGVPLMDPQKLQQTLDQLYQTSQ